MNKRKEKKSTGFTLLELLLVLAIISMLMFLMAGYFQQQTLQARVERTTQQMQQVLNAGLAYYVQNGTWPPAGHNNNLTCLFGTTGYPNSPSTPCTTQFIVPNVSKGEAGNDEILNSPWGNPYFISSPSPTSGNNTSNPFCNVPKGVPCTLFFVYAKIQAGKATAAIANTIIGKLPNSYTSTTSAEPYPPTFGDTCEEGAEYCYVVAAVNIPGQNLNNAGAVNFAGLYHHGGCVPVPACPLGSAPQIMVVPVSVSGLNYTGSPDVYPISSFTASATPPSASPGGCPNDPNQPPSCSPLVPVNTNPVTNQFWRACLTVITENGNVASTNTGTGAGNSSGSVGSWAYYVTLMAMTRCAIQNEPAGSDYTKVFGNNT